MLMPSCLFNLDDGASYHSVYPYPCLLFFLPFRSFLALISLGCGLPAENAAMEQHISSFGMEIFPKFTILCMKSHVIYLTQLLLPLLAPSSLFFSSLFGKQ